MNWLGHVIVAVLLFFVLNFFLPSIFPQNFALFAVFVASALVPDIDHRKSVASRMSDALVLLAILILSFSFAMKDSLFFEIFLLYTLIGFGAYYLILEFLRPKHRGIMHSLFMSGIYGTGMYLLSGSLIFGIAAMLGYLSHLLADFEIKLI